MNFKGKKVAVLGLGIEGVDALNFLLDQGALVSIHDAKEENDLDKSQVKGSVKYICGKDYLRDLGGYDYIVRSPGIYRYKSELVNSEKQGVKITSAIDIFLSLCPGKVIGVTGTKGKGTTSTLIYEILKKDAKDVHLAGNIGKPFLSLLPDLNKKSIVVLELSSFQLIGLSQSPHISVVLNITLDHMDWHKNKREYIDAKKSIVRYQDGKDFALINSDYEVSKGFEKLTKAKKFFFSRRESVRGCYVKDQKIILHTGKTYEIGKTKDLTLRGEHNQENICAAICAASLAGADVESIKKVVFDFKGLEHRLEFVRNVNGVSFYNDSFGTGPETAIAAINSFTEPLTIILGGFDKGLDYKELAKVMASKENVLNAILIGDIRNTIKSELVSAGFGGKIADLGKDSMERIVGEALKNTSQGGVVLLAPATSSFDMFKDYKERGNKFKSAVNDLKPNTRVSAAMVTYKDQILLFLRDDNPKIKWPNHWSSIGGHAEEGETKEEALIRELKEEIGIIPSDYKYITDFVGIVGETVSMFHVVLTKIDKRRLKLGNEGQKIQLFPIEDIHKLKLTPNLEIMISIYHRYLANQP